MRILYVSRLCSQKVFDELFEKLDVKPLQPAQKFHHLFVKGLAELNKVTVTTLSSLPISSNSSKKIVWSIKPEVEGNVKFKYILHINILLFGHLITFLLTFFHTFVWCLFNRKHEKYILCDVLNLTISVAAKSAAKLFGVKSVAIVTDIPIFMESYTSKEQLSKRKKILMSLYTKICSNALIQYDAYVVLTEQMNELVNPKSTPYVVIEGMVDYQMVDIINKYEHKYKEKIIIYAGALYEKYGVKKLIDAFMLVTNSEAELWLYGSGELENYIKLRAKQDKRIKFFGMIANSKVVEEELKATLLVNPRPSNEEYTKYSFPSKNMEYMVSGTALLTTLLPGMPLEYKEHVILFDDESMDNISKKIEEVLLMDEIELFNIGLRAKKFILSEKSNVMQAEKLYNLLKKARTIN